MQTRVDELDLRILAALQNDGRLSNQDLADQVALSPSACLRRVRSLEENGFIRGYHAELDAGLLGFEFEAVVHVTLDKVQDDWHEHFLRDIQRLREVISAYVVSGSCNYILHIRTRTLAEFSKFLIDQFTKIPGVRDTCSFVVLHKYKSEAHHVPIDRDR